MSKPNKKGANYHFHPLEISFVGFSGAGKSTLIEKLLQRLSPVWKIAYVKHDAHSFQVDREGKDTFRARQGGAVSAFINNESEFAWMGAGRLSLFQQKSLFLDHDALLVEGYKSLDMDKIVVLDGEGQILSEIGNWDRVLAFVGVPSTPPPLPVDRPYFQRDNGEALATFIQEKWREKSRGARPLYGLVLAGGQSQRMGEDKGRIRYQGESEALRCYHLLKDLGLPTFLSLRKNQWSDDETRGLPILFDQFENAGPLCGILTAMQTHPEASWLVLACDLPLLTRPVLENLLEARRPEKMATAYRSVTEPDFPEPLCAIYEASIRMRFYEALALGLACPRKVLLQSNTALIEAFDASALTNVNNPEEAREARFRLQESL